MRILRGVSFPRKSCFVEAAGEAWGRPNINQNLRVSHLRPCIEIMGAPHSSRFWLVKVEGRRKHAQHCSVQFRSRGSQNTLKYYHLVSPLHLLACTGLGGTDRVSCCMQSVYEGPKKHINVRIFYSGSQKP